MVSARELRDLDVPELLTRLREAKEELFNLRFQHATGQLDNTARLSQARKDVARILTVLREREIRAAEALERREAERGEAESGEEERREEEREERGVPR